MKERTIYFHFIFCFYVYFCFYLYYLFFYSQLKYIFLPFFSIFLLFFFSGEFLLQYRSRKQLFVRARNERLYSLQQNPTQEREDEVSVYGHVLFSSFLPYFIFIQRPHFPSSTLFFYFFSISLFIHFQFLCFFLFFSLILSLPFSFTLLIVFSSLDFLILFYLMSSYLILSYLILFYLILFYLILSYLILFYLILSFHILSYII